MPRHWDISTSSGPGLWCRQCHEAKPVISHRGQLGAVVLDVAVPGDGDPPCAGRHGDPVEVPGVRGRDRAGRSLALVEYASGVAGIRDVAAEGCDELAEPEDVSVEVEPDLRCLHAARAETS
jgi:hypothetical protein